ncbi:CAP domain-containing protein [Paenibacillus sp. NPDC093718]|uniref:CAP domain-containing protein n=1 Tax=Paenibacillus sp. NPDC093718 TaxID=3390601 RepID=UPI003CFC942D
MKASKRSKNDRQNRGIGRRSGRRWAACLLAAVLALTVVVPAYPAESASAASATMASQGGFTQDQLDGLAYLNEIRAKVGVGPLELDARLTQASQAHAAYYIRRIVGPSGGAGYGRIYGSDGRRTGQSSRMAKHFGS